MNELQFVYWYCYFDTLFSKKQPIAYRSLISMLPTKSTDWPINKCQLPQLCQCFSQLQKYIVQQKNWSQSICTIDQLNKIQADVNNLLLLLEIQKLYISNFWDDSKRRVQASVTHLYALLQIFVGSIIPYSNMTLFQCKAANKLCMKIINLQNLFKSIMKRINTICVFFSDSYFDQQGLILKNFFQNFVAFMQLIPKIKKFKMFHNSELLKYIMIVNTLQVVSLDRKKHMKLTAKLKNNYIVPQNVKTVSLSKINNKKHWIIAKKRKYNSCIKIKFHEQLNNQYLQKNSNVLRFIFPNWIRRHSIKYKKQSLPKLRIESFANIAKGKSNSQFKISQSPQKKLRNKSATKSQTRNLMKSASINQGQTPLKNPRSKKSNTIQRNPISQQQQDIYDNQDDQTQLLQPLSSTIIRQIKFTKNMSEQIKNIQYTNKFKPNLISLKLQSQIQFSKKKQQINSMAMKVKQYILMKQIQDIINS